MSDYTRLDSSGLPQMSNLGKPALVTITSCATSHSESKTQCIYYNTPNLATTLFLQVNEKSFDLKEGI